MDMSGALSDVYVLVEYAFEYTAKDGKLISIQPNERYRLLARTNDHWWQVQKDENSRPFYIPAKYVRELLSVPQLSNGFGELQGQDEQRTVHYQGSLDLLSQIDDSAQNLQSAGHTMSTFGIKTENCAANRSKCSGSTSDLQQMSLEASKTEENPSVIQDVSLIPLRRDKRSSGGFLATLGSFESLQRQSNRNRTSYTPGLSPANYFSSVENIRPCHSLGDLQRLSSEKRASFPHENQFRKLGARVESWSLPRSSTVSDSENIYESIPDLIEQTVLPPKRPTAAPRRLGKPAAAAQAFDKGEQNSAVYANVEELKRQVALSSPPPEEPSAKSEEWETHVDQDSGQVFYYNVATGQTTWDSPFETTEDSLSCPNSPSPSPTAQGNKTEWETVFDAISGQPYYYNPHTGETSWELPLQEEDSGSYTMVPVFKPLKPLEIRPPTPEKDYPEVSVDENVPYPEEDYSPTWSHDSYTYSQIPEWSPKSLGDPDTPSGWTCDVDEVGQLLYTSNYTQEQWVKSEDENGMPYFYSLVGSKSQWELPQIQPPYQKRTGSDSDVNSNIFPNWRQSVIDSVALKDPDEKSHHLKKAGILHKTKICENGKRLRKNWSTSWTVLEGQILTLYKDIKGQPSGNMKQTSSQMPTEHTVELRGATIVWAVREKSSKKNVLELKTRDGDEYLLQHDQEATIRGWHEAITESIQQQAVAKPEENHNYVQNSVAMERSTSNNSLLRDKDEKDKRNNRTSRLLSVSSTGQENDNKKVRSKLRKLLQRRPTLQSVKEKGYIKDQVFGCHLDVLCKRENTTVPLFVRQCIQSVEKRGLDIDGIYRVSGNLAVIQKLRFKVDHEENLDLDDGQWDDIHILTGALKLFFRELPEPLFPFANFEQFVAAIKTPDLFQRKKCMRDLVHTLPPPNHDTMKVLFRHLRKVIEYRDKNRMSVQSLSIVFGPTLLKPEDEGGNIALHMVVQNQIVEHILNEYDRIFAES